MTKLHLPDMSCGHCKASVEAALAPLAQGVRIDLAARTVTVTSADLAAITNALDKIGFAAEILAD